MFSVDFVLHASQCMMLLDNDVTLTLVLTISLMQVSGERYNEAMKKIAHEGSQ